MALTRVFAALWYAGALVVIGAADTVTGYEFGFSLFYLAPIVTAACFAGSVG